MFVEIEPVAVSDEAGNTIYVRPKMGKGVEAQVSAEFGRLGGRTQAAYELCLLAYNVVRWDGPAFVDASGKPVAITRANIDRLDPDEPLVRRTISRIAELNTPRMVRLPAENGTVAASTTDDDPTPAAVPI